MVKIIQLSLVLWLQWLAFLKGDTEINPCDQVLSDGSNLIQYLKGGAFGRWLGLGAAPQDGPLDWTLGEEKDDGWEEEEEEEEKEEEKEEKLKKKKEKAQERLENTTVYIDTLPPSPSLSLYVMPWDT